MCHSALRWVPGLSTAHLLLLTHDTPAKRYQIPHHRSINDSRLIPFSFFYGHLKEGQSFLTID